MTEAERMKLHIELVDATAEFRIALALRERGRDRIVRLSRALVLDASLTDEEALKAAYPDALETTLRLAKKGT